MEQTATGTTTRVIKAFYNGERSIIKTDNSDGEASYFAEGEIEAGKELDVYTEDMVASFDCVLDNIRSLTETLRLASHEGCVNLFDALLRDAENYVRQLNNAVVNGGVNIEVVRLQDHTCNNARYNNGNQIIDIIVDRV